MTKHKWPADMNASQHRRGKLPTTGELDFFTMITTTKILIITHRHERYSTTPSATGLLSAFYIFYWPF